jgi:hypothetical protein
MNNFLDVLYKKLILPQETETPLPVKPVPDIIEMIKPLFCISEEEWGEYLFSREIAGSRINESLKKKLIQEAILCGKEYAQNIKIRYGNISVDLLADKLQVHVNFHHEELDNNFYIFSQFAPPDHIGIFTAYIKSSESVLKKIKDQGLLQNFNVQDILLAHELFHFLEEQDKISIFTRTERMTLWSLGPFKGTSPILCLGEIAAMAFTKEICSLSNAPNILDVVLTYGTEPSVAIRICEKMLTFHKIS